MAAVQLVDRGLDPRALLPEVERAGGQLLLALGERRKRRLHSPLLLRGERELLGDERLELAGEAFAVLVQLAPRRGQLAVARGDASRLLPQGPLALDEIGQRGAAFLQPVELLQERLGEPLGHPLILLPGRAGGKVRALSDGASRSPSAPKRIALTVVAVVGWAGLALLGALVKLALLPRRRSAGLSAAVWGILFAAYLWWGSHQIGLRENRAVALGIVGGAAAALFVYLRGSSLERPPADRPGVFLGRLAAKRRGRSVSR